LRLVLLGPPGSGKGTQSLFLHEKIKVPSISTGDIFREACRNKTLLGMKVAEFMASGQLVPDDVVLEIIEDRLSQRDCQQGYILDGFPRTEVQAKVFDKKLKNRREFLDYVLNFEVDDADLVVRLSGRRQCSRCGAGYHASFAPPSTEGVCDRCGAKLFQREDDKEETIRRRLKIYKEQTKPLIQYYKQKGILKNIKGQGEAKEVFDLISKEIGIY